jgi:hypothetical protein
MEAVPAFGVGKNQGQGNLCLPFMSVLQQFYGIEFWMVLFGCQSQEASDLLIMDVQLPRVGGVPPHGSDGKRVGEQFAINPATEPKHSSRASQLRVLKYLYLRLVLIIPENSHFFH